MDLKGSYGNAVLTRKVPAAIEHLDISLPGREPRGAIVIMLNICGQSVRIVATHLGLHPRERRYQVQRLLALLDGETASVTLVLGDFNEWFTQGRPLRWLNRRLGKMPAAFTFPSRRPLLALDRIWVCPSDRLLSLRPHRSATAAAASDHLPLVAKVRV
jgi:endonuclease/exonuclease/phosphatase family metal-dependent hydrolase